LTLQAAPIMLSVRHLGDDPVALQQAFDGFAYLGPVARRVSECRVRGELLGTRRVDKHKSYATDDRLKQVDMDTNSAMHSNLDVLVVGAGPTGLTLASQLARFDVRFRIVDKALDRARESRALAVQARSLEVLQCLALGETLTSRGRTTTQLMLHVDRGEPVAIDLGHIGRSDTRFPYILFVSQSDTEGVLSEHLASQNIAIERGVELVSFQNEANALQCVLRHSDGREESIRVTYLAGCDGAHSAVRKGAGIPFEGGAYPQEFALGDVEADGLAPLGAIHAFGAGRGFAMFFPLGRPTTWRVMAMEAGALAARADEHEEVTTHELALPDLQAMVADPTFGSVTLRDAAWLTRFRLHHRQAMQYRKGSVFLAGDAAHIHSPVGAQGMNTGIQDAWNLGWKLAWVVEGRADDRLLDTYHAERWPVGRTLLRATDRLFSAFARSVSGSDPVMWLRRVVVRGVVAPALRRPRIRALAFHFVSQLGVHYRRSPLVAEGEPALRGGPRAGDRLPDAHVQRAAAPTYLQQELSGPHLYLLLCGPVGIWDEQRLTDLLHTFSDVMAITHLTRDDARDALVDVRREAFARLGIERAGQYIVRPDGHIGFRCAGTDLSGATEYLNAWLSAMRA
jgi:2-polyprenyl-6-methoxyphenol hydroxylase-like FAD-dependent oxidoreductase